MSTLRIRTLAEEEAFRFAAEGDPRLPVRAVLQGHRPAAGERLLLVTERDLTLPWCESLFGYADRGRGVAVVSTFRLRGGDEARTAARLAKVIEHERGHLDGLGHCRMKGCVMAPAGRVEDVDARGLQRCERCRRPRASWKAKAAAVAVCVLMVAAAQGLASLVKVKRPPFSWRSREAAALVLFEQQPLLMVATEAEARRAADALNGLYAQITPPPIEVAMIGSKAVLVAKGLEVAVVEGDRHGSARAWAARVDWLMRAKGDETKGCPSCHIRRLAEVEAAARMRRERRW